MRIVLCLVGFRDITLVWCSGKVRNPVLGRIDDPFLIVRIQHGGLDIGMSEHVLDLMDRGASLERDRGCRMPEGMGRNPSDVLGVADRLIQ